MDFIAFLRPTCIAIAKCRRFPERREVRPRRSVNDGGDSDGGGSGDGAEQEEEQEAKLKRKSGATAPNGHPAPCIVLMLFY